MTSNVMKLLCAEYGARSTAATKHRITVVGAGQVGMATVFSILAQGVSNDVVVIDHAKDKLKGEVLDIQHGSPFLKNAHIQAGSDYAVSAGSRICVVTAGARQKEGESRLSLVQRNTDILKEMIPKLVKYSPDTILMIVSNPVDVLTYVAWKASGLPLNKVIGSGTNLDTSRFRVLLSKRLSVSPTSCHAWIIGEHGDSSIAVWSSANVTGVRLCELDNTIGTKTDKEKFGDIHRQVIQAAYEVIKLKGYTSWAIGLSVTALIQSIVNNSANVHAVSVCVKGQHGIPHEVFLSLPCVMEQNGAVAIIKQHLNEQEKKMLYESAEMMKKVQDGLKI